MDDFQSIAVLAQRVVSLDQIAHPDCIARNHYDVTQFCISHRRLPWVCLRELCAL